MNIEIIVDARYSPQQLAELAVAAEQGGVRTLWHPNMHSSRDAFVALVPAALLTLNEIAGGRALAAIGGGGSVLSAIREDGIRIDYRKLRVVRGVREAVEIVRGAAHGALARGTYSGELFTITRPSRTDWAGPQPARVYTCSDGPQMTRLAGRLADGVVFGDLTIHRAAEVMGNLRAGMAQRTTPAEDFRIVNYWAWHIKKQREHSLYEARRSLVWRTQIVPPFHGLDLIVDEPTAQRVRDNFENFAKAYWTRSGQIEGVPPALVEHLVHAVSSSGDYGAIEGEIERYAALAQAGFTDLALKVFDDPMESIRLICERVVPRFA